MAEKTFGWCFIGSGSITRRVLKDFPLMENGAYVAAVYSRTLENAKKLADEAGATPYDNLEAAITDPRVQAVYVATTNDMHKEHTLQALRLGKPVVCEKPFAINTREAREMYAAAKERRLFLMEGMWTRFMPAIQKALEWIRAGKIGPVTSLRADFSVDMPKGVARIFEKDMGGGALLDLGIYVLAIAQFVFGEKPSRIQSIATLTDGGVDQRTAIALQYPSGAIAQLFCALDVPMPNEAVIYGEKGKIIIPHFVFSDTVELHAKDGMETFTDDTAGEGFVHEFSIAQADILASRTENALVSQQYTLDVMETMDEIRRQIGLSFSQDTGIKFAHNHAEASSR